MPETLDYPLNPMDNILLATNESLRQRGYCGLSVMLIADVQGSLEPAELAGAVKRLGREFPALSAHVRFTRLRQRAYWHIDDDAPLEEAIEYAYHDLRSSGEDADEPLRKALDDPVDPMCGRQLRLVHLQLSKDRHRLGLRWPHPLMDLEGGHLLLNELHAALSDTSLTLGRDPRARPPAPYRSGLLVRWLRVWQGRLLHTRYDAYRQPRVVAGPGDRPPAANFCLRRYDVVFRRQFEATARQRTAPGPLRYTRALMIAIARTYVQMAEERGRPRDYYLFSHALPVPRQGPRPGVHGNHITIPWIIFHRSDLVSWSAADAAALSQFADYTGKKRDQATWEMLHAKQRWPFALTRAFIDHRCPPAAAGCTSYRFGDAVTRLGSATITNLAAIGPANCHPGWIVADSTYRGSMSIALTFFEDHFDPPSVVEFLDRLEATIVGKEPGSRAID